jgi:hypothetical protein
MRQFNGAAARLGGTLFSSSRFSSVPIDECRETFMSDFRDIQHGVNDPVDGVDVKRKFNDNQTPHERAQSAADVRSSAIPAPDEEFLPEALRRRPTGPLNPRTGRRPAA